MATSRHKRETNARHHARFVRIAAPAAVLVTAGAVGAGVLGATPDSRELVTASQASISVDAPERPDFLSRSFSREAVDPRALEKAAARKATAKAIRKADTRLWTTADLNIWTASGGKARKIGLLDSGKKVLVTGRRAHGRAEVVLEGKARWVTADYLSAEKPEPQPTLGGTCTNGSSVPSGVSPNVVAVHRAVCASFPELTSYGTFRSDGEHAQGLAIDIMVSGDRGWQVAEFLRANYSQLGISYLIYAQRIWSVDRGGEGWRGMSDRGSATANHYDHVHVTTY